MVRMTMTNVELFNAWLCRLDTSSRESMLFDYRDQYENELRSLSSADDLEWLKENWEHLWEDYQEFVHSKEPEKINQYRQLAKAMESPSLKFEDYPRMRICEPGGAWVDARVWVSNQPTAKISIWQDSKAESPNDNRAWSLYSFNSRHPHFVHPANVDKERLKDAREVELAFRLAFKDNRWYFFGTVESPQVEYAGYVIWDGPERGPRGSRAESAMLFLDDYNKWWTQEVYGYTLESAGAGSSQGGFFDMEQLARSVRESLPEGTAVVFSGECAAEAERLFLRMNFEG